MDASAVLEAFRNALAALQQPKDDDVALPLFDPDKSDNGASNWCDSIETLAKELKWSSIKTAAKAVFCLQTSAIIPIGDIFLFGNTAALAWVLPSQPEFFNMIKEHYNYKAERRQDLNEIFYLDENGKVIAKVPYKRKTLISPVFAKRSVEDNQDLSFKEKLRLKFDKPKMHEEQKNREYLNEKHMNKRSIEFHRSSRIDLYGKLEKLLTALGRDGRACVLQKLCESKQTTDQGTFLQELARVLFTLPKSSEYVNEEHRDYDTAHHESNNNCSILYPGCDVNSEMTL